nr:MAG TPA: hypothetical protein [Caudoviricetes sp.]
MHMIQVTFLRSSLFLGRDFHTPNPPSRVFATHAYT